MKKRVVSRKCLPQRIPVTQPAVIYLLLEHFHAPMWLYGALGALFALLILAAIVEAWQEVDVDIFGGQK